MKLQMKLRRKGLAVLACCLLMGSVLGGCKKETEQDSIAVAYLGEEPVELEEAVFYTRMLQEQWEAAYYEYYGDQMWQEPFEGGEETFAQVFKQDVMDTLTEIHLLTAHAREYGVELTKEEKETVARRATAFMESNTPEVLKAAGATKELVEKLLLRNELAAKVAQTVQESYEPEIDPKQAKVGKLTYCLFSVMGTYDAEGNHTPFTQEELEEIRNEAAEFALRAEALGDISAAGEEISHTVIDVYYNDWTDGGAHEEVAQAARDLKVGGVSGIIETDDGYYIVQNVSEYDETGTQEHTEEMRRAAKERHQEELLEKWEEETPLQIDEELWDSVKVEELLTR